MKPFRWSSEKNETIKAERGISFERIVVSIEASGVLDILAHPNQAKYPRQRVLVVACDNYAYLERISVDGISADKASITILKGDDDGTGDERRQLATERHAM
ncbi:MAG: hypothetical protein M0P39_05215, partial [Rhodocyclaceae bacterium]|nr:hypothetical protein [Rhodocyclaceae bacterium]